MHQAAPRNLDLVRLAEHHRMMVRIRAFEQAALRGLEQKLVRGALHPSIGQEAVASGICLNLHKEDILLSTHRGHGHTLAKGAEPLAMMRELFGREGGNCGGKGGSMHIADFAVGMLGANGVVGANIVIAVGAAHALAIKGESRIVCCIFGDGAINRGPFLEGLNWAQVFALPVLFVCEDNGFAATTRTPAMSAGAGPLARAKSLGIQGLEVDGNDVMAVEEAARDLLAAVRGGGGPRFLHAKTYRLTGHTAADAAPYRPAGEVEARWRDDPIAQAEALLHAAGRGSEVEAARAGGDAEMVETYAEAAASPYPAPERALADVQDVGDPRREAF
jgi:acetoin:2,6-dichlorophenolindophenol oxidoreductase subunit alpha